MSEWATHAEELERKAIDATLGLADKLASGAIDRDAYFLAVTAVYDTISGLVDRKIQDMVLKAREPET